MHLQQIKIVSQEKREEVERDQMSDDEEELEHTHSQQAFPDGRGSLDDPNMAQDKPVADSTMHDDELSKAMANLSTICFVPRSVQMRGKK
jgi:hypothetical protein